MKQNKSNVKAQVEYLGRWVDRDSFCAFVYNKQSDERLAKNFNEFEGLIASGLWFASKELIPIDKQSDRKSKRAATISDS